MYLHSLAAVAAIVFSTYPGFDKPGAQVEAVIDRGSISELIVRCPAGTAIISYSKLERLYCTPARGCVGDLAGAIRTSCR